MADANEAVHVLRTTAHRESVQIAMADLVDALCDKLGITLVAYLADRDKSTISRWRLTQVNPGEDALRPLRFAYQVFTMLERADAASTVRAWFMGANPQLDDLSPIEAIRKGQNREVLAAARAFLAGA